MSYRKYHVKTKIGRIKPKIPIFKKWWFWTLILFIASLMGFCYLIVFYPGFQVKNIIVSGSEKMQEGPVKDEIFLRSETGLINFWIFKVSSRSIFLINLKKVSQDMLNKYPLIENLNLQKKFPSTILVSMRERKPTGAYCSMGECFFIDHNGIAYETMTAENASGFLIIRQTTEEERQIFAGKRAINENLMQAIVKIQNKMANLRISLREVFITSPLRLNALTEENWQIYFNVGPNSSINSQLLKLEALLNNEISKEIRDNLHYIDLRPRDRAIFCDNDDCYKNSANP